MMTKMINQFIASDQLDESFDNLFIYHLLPYYVKKLKKGDVIFEPNSYHKYSYYVKSGLVKICIVSPEGKEKTLFFHEPGSIFGFQNINYHKQTITRASAISDTELYQFDFDIFYEYIKNSPTYFSSFLDYIFQMFILQTEEVVNLSFYTTIERFAALLLVLVDEQGQQYDGCISFNNEELSAMIGASRNSISSAISILKKFGVIEKRRNGIIIKDFKRLQDIVTNFDSSVKI